MDSASFSLSGRGLSNAAALEERNFVFVVGGVEYPCCRFQACFVSNRVSRLLHSDCCISRLSLTISDDMGHFKDVMRLMNGYAISITPENAPFLEACARELECDELLGCIMSFHLDSDVSLWNVADRIRIKGESHSDYKNEINFLASHFSEVGIDVLRKLSISDLESVLVSPQLKLESHDQLYDIISSLAGDCGDDYLILLRHVQIKNLSESRRSQFLDQIFPDLVNAEVWNSLCECARHYDGSNKGEPLANTGGHCCNESATLMKPTLPRFVEFTSANGAFNGIVRHIRNRCGGNPHCMHELTITPSSWLGPWERIIDYGWCSHWYSFNEPDSYVQFDFKSRRVCISQYSLKSASCQCHLLSWAIEVSDDGQHWDVIDLRNTHDLEGEFIERTYDCNRPNNRFVQYVRLRQTGKNSSNCDILVLSEIEFFGKLTE